MRFVVTFWINDVQKVRLFKKLEEAQAFLKKARKEHPEYKDFKLKVIKFLK
jgi:hypothetical protein